MSAEAAPIEVKLGNIQVPVELTITQEANEEEPIVPGRRPIFLPTPEGVSSSVLVHDTAVLGRGLVVGQGRGPIGENAVIGRNVAIHGALYVNVELGDNVWLGERTRLGNIGDAKELGKIAIGKEVKIGAGTYIYSPGMDSVTTIGQGAEIGANVRIGGNEKKRSKVEPVIIGLGANIADGTIIQSHVTIGEFAKIEPGYEIVAGVTIPAGVVIKRNPNARVARNHESTNVRTLSKYAKEKITKKWLKDNRRLIEPIKR